MTNDPPPYLRHFRSSVRLCAACDRPSLCAVIARGTAPCGMNDLGSFEEYDPPRVHPDGEERGMTRAEIEDAVIAWVEENEALSPDYDGPYTSATDKLIQLGRQLRADRRSDPDGIGRWLSEIQSDLARVNAAHEQRMREIL